MDKLVVTLLITVGLYLMVLFAIFADLWSGVRKAKKNGINLLDGTERNANKYSSDMEKIDQILESLYDRVISLTKASITNILNAIDLTSASTNRNLGLSTNAQTIINADTGLTAKVTAATTAGWTITYVTR